MYEWIKAFHIMAVIAWMAGMLYLPRLFVYHTESPVGSPQSETFKVMERRLIRGIINPSMIVVWVLGLWMAYDAPWYDELWLQLKFALVIVMSGLHGFFVRCWRDFDADRNMRSAKFYRIINEVPAVLVVLIVLLVVLKPFR
ncbi:MAG: protoporphyrinogen oxidase HemJ [Xanthobacteraceae bacterium]